jgi:hypothetical protein
LIRFHRGVKSTVDFCTDPDRDMPLRCSLFVVMAPKGFNHGEPPADARAG